MSDIFLALAALALVASSIMLVRRFLGSIVMSRLVARCEPIGHVCDEDGLDKLVTRLAREARLKRPPEVLALPEGTDGAFACGGRRGRILLGRDLVATLDHDELEAVVAHEVPILDTSGDAFKQGLNAAPGIIKPNRHEAEDVLGRAIEGEKMAAAAAAR